MKRENNYKDNLKRFNLLGLLTVVFFIGSIFFVFEDSLIEASTVAELEERIKERNQNIAELQREIDQYQRQVNATRQEAQTLQGAIRELDLTSGRILAEINLIENRINAANLNLQRILIEIGEKEDLIEQNNQTIALIIRNIHEKDGYSLVEALLAYKNLSDFWSEIETLERFHIGIKGSLAELQTAREELDRNKSEVERNKEEMVFLTEKLNGQHQVIAYNKEEQRQLLSSTQNEEAAYKRLLDQKIAQRKAFEQELLDFESQLRIAVDPTRIPASRSGVLSWPLDNVRITQYFGNTPFATSNPQVYGGMGHNGIDLGTPIGTPVKSAAGGVVMGTGDTDTVCRNASWGKWILVRHDNGLSTLYAHLSVINVSQGQAVNRGQIIGYSGNTGFSTGPHLHFTVYASQGVQISNFPSRACGGVYTMPVADQKAYLNPLSFL